LDFSNNNNVTNNNASGNSREGIYLDYFCNSNNITNNNVSGNSYGIHLYYSSNNNISKNSIFDNSYGVYMRISSNFNSIIYNNITSNSDYGVNITNSTIGNRIHHNNLINNHAGGKQGYDKSGDNFWNDTSVGNYWSDFDTPAEGCYDNNTNGICDGPYLIDGGTSAKDNYPLTTPQFRDISPPYLVNTTPKQNESSVPVETKITIQWNENMNSSSAEAAFSSVPSINCTWSWDGPNQTCTPSTKLQPDTRYTITISTSAKDLAGNAMKESYEFSFTTANEITSNSYQISAIIILLACVIVITLLFIPFKRKKKSKEKQETARSSQ